MARWLGALSLALVFLSGAEAKTSCALPEDYGIACHDLATGEVLWQTPTRRSGPPTISVQGELVIVESTISTIDGDERILYALSREDGRPAPGGIPPHKAGERHEPLEPLPRNLTAPDGSVFEYESFPRHLVAVADGQTRIIRQLESRAHDLHIAGSLALFTFGAGSLWDTGGGEVYAYDLEADALRWEFDGSKGVQDLPEDAATGLAVDGERILVHTDQTIFALRLEDGRREWMARLPRQAIRPFDGGPRVRIGRVGDLLLVDCYERLFALGAEDGKLVWSFDCGAFGEPWPTVAGNRLFVGTRGTEEPADWSLLRGEPERPENSALVVSRAPENGAGYEIRFLSRRDIPRDAEMWWSLRPPPAPTPDAQRVVIRLIQDPDLPPWEAEGYPFETTIDLSEPLRTQGKAYVKFGAWTDKAVLVVGGEEVHSKIKPGSHLKRDRWAPAESLTPLQAAVVFLTVLIPAAIAVVWWSIRRGWVS